jgi:hypothetical protein
VRALYWAATAIWTGVFVGRAVGSTWTDGDSWWQLALGHDVLRTPAIPSTLLGTYTAAGAPWVAQEWVFSVGLAWCTDHGLLLPFSVLIALCAVATVALIGMRAWALGAGQFAALAAILGGLALVESFGVRAQVAGWPFLALFLLLAERRDRLRFWAIPVVVLWANVHASVLLAPIVALAAFAGSLFDARESAPPLGERIAFVLAVALATLCTPFGIRLPLMALEWSLGPDTAYIVEWARPSLRDVMFLCAGVLPAAIVVADVVVRRLSWSQRCVAVFAIVAMAQHGRNLALAATIILPYAALVLAGVRRTGDASARWSRSDYGIAAIGALGALGLAVLQLRLPTVPYPGQPAAAAVRALPGEQRVYCEDFSWCSLFADVPHVRVYLDGRTDAYPPAVFRSWALVHNARPGWERVLLADGTTTIVAASNGLLAKAVRRSPRWRRCYRGAGVTVYVRPGTTTTG